jgi:hypothetical protein
MDALSVIGRGFGGHSHDHGGRRVILAGFDHTHDVPAPARP